MKRIFAILSVGLLFVAAIGFTSCHKCTTCRYNYTGPQGETLTYTYPEVCGNTGDINDIEDLCEAESLTHAGDCYCD